MRQEESEDTMAFLEVRWNLQWNMYRNICMYRM